jgi:hypothetical protein
MNDLRLLGAVEEAALRVSLESDIDVAVSPADGSTSIYMQGKDATPPWLAAAAPEKRQAQPVAYADMTPVRIQFGRWHEELEKFIPSRTLTVSDFLSLHRTAK